MKKELVLGDVVISQKGRDCGKTFVVVKLLGADFVSIADGEVHLLKKSKKKNVKHVKYTGKNLDTIARKLTENKKVFDSEIRSALRAVTE